MNRKSNINPKDPKPRGGFTLVELLVVIGILIVLTVMTITMVNVTQDEDRVRAGAAQVQSYLEGARDRAIHAGELRGVRLLPDNQNPNLVTSLIYVGAPSVYGDPESDVERHLIIRKHQNQTTGDINFYVELPNNERIAWDNFFSRGLIESGKSVLKIGKAPYTFLRTPLQGLPGQQYVLTAPIASVNVPRPYLLHLNPVVLPNQEPRLLPRNVVIDLDNSDLPPSWGGPRPTAPMAPYGTMDVMFSPDGTVAGVEAPAGVVNLVVADQQDIDLGFSPGVQQVTVSGETIERAGNERIVSLKTQTGSIGVHNVDPTDSNNDMIPDDWRRYAALGETAK